MSIPILVRVSTQERPWAVHDVALPCATQNELNEIDAKQLATNGCFV